MQRGSGVILSGALVGLLLGSARLPAADEVSKPEPGSFFVVAGTGQQGLSGDGGPAIAARLAIPHAICFDAAGNLYIAEVGNNRVRMVTRDGMITSAVKGGSVADVAVDGAGNLFITGGVTPEVRKMDVDGVISTFLGSAAGLQAPAGIAVDARDDVYLADWTTFRVWKVGADGTVSPVAGTGEQGYSGDDGPALQARLNSAHGGLAVDAAGNLYIPDAGNHRVRKVTPDGTISTVAGTGEAGFSGDGRLATEAWLNEPHDIAVDSAGNLFIADWRNHRVRKVGPDGMIITVAGMGKERRFEMQGRATEVALRGPFSVAIDPQGDLLIADSSYLQTDRWGPMERVVKVTGVAAPGLVAGRPFPQPQPQ